MLFRSKTINRYLRPQSFRPLPDRPFPAKKYIPPIPTHRMDTRPVDRPPSTLRIKIYNRNTKTNNLFRIRHPAAGIIYSYLYPVNYTQTKKTMIEKLLLTFGIATALSLSAPDAAAAPKGGDLTGDAFLDRKSTRLNSSHRLESRMPSSA